MDAPDYAERRLNMQSHEVWFCGPCAGPRPVLDIAYYIAPGVKLEVFLAGRGVYGLDVEPRAHAHQSVIIRMPGVMMWAGGRVIDQSPAPAHGRGHLFPWCMVACRY
jgi:hypothetical protein